MRFTFKWSVILQKSKSPTEDWFCADGSHIRTNYFIGKLRCGLFSAVSDCKAWWQFRGVWEEWLVFGLLGVRSLFTHGATAVFWTCDKPILVVTNVPSNLLKSVCAENFFCATFYLNSSDCGMMCMKMWKKHFWRDHLCALQVFLCALISRPVCIRKALREHRLLLYNSYSINTMIILTRDRSSFSESFWWLVLQLFVSWSDFVHVRSNVCMRWMQPHWIVGTSFEFLNRCCERSQVNTYKMLLWLGFSFPFDTDRKNVRILLWKERAKQELTCAVKHVLQLKLL